MENLNVEQVKRGLERCANEWHCGLCGFTEKECALIKKRALSLIKSQEQKIFDLENRIKECDNGYEGTLHLERCKLHDAEEKIKELDVELKAMRGAANSYKIHIIELTEEKKKQDSVFSDLYKEAETYLAQRECLRNQVKKLTEENARLEKLCALRDQDNKDTQDLLYKAEAKNTELEKKYALAVAEREANVKGFSETLVVIHDDTVRKMQEMLTKEFERMHKTNFFTPEVRQWIIDQIAKEMIGEGEKP